MKHLAVLLTSGITTFCRFSAGWQRRPISHEGWQHTIQLSLQFDNPTNLYI